VQRSEHNDGCLFQLEELAMHQQDLERIELLGRVCPSLRILTLQANSIPRFENLHRLKVTSLVCDEWHKDDRFHMFMPDP